MTRPDRAWRDAWLILATALLLRLVLAARVPLVQDEAYYWEWSRRLAGGYFDHPPAIAWSIGLGTRLFALLGLPLSPLAVRFVPAIQGTIAAAATMLIAGRLGGPASARLAALVMSVMPLAAAGLVLATPDAPLLAGTALGCYGVTRAIQSPLRSRASLGWWVFTGVALGLAFSSKYTSILLPLGVVAGVLLHRELRPRLLEPGPWVACVVATLVFLPVLRWNASHEWISFAYQLEHGLGRPRGNPLGRELELIGGQMGLVSPILFVLASIAVMRSQRGLRHRDAGASPERALLGAVALVAFAFFMVSALRKPVEANWPAPAYIPAMALLASTPWADAGRRWVRRGWQLALVLSALVYAHGLFTILPLAARRDPVARGAGFDALGLAMAAAVRDAESQDGTQGWVAADRYQDAAELAFHMPAHPTVFSTNLSGRRNQYDLWPRFPEVAQPGQAMFVALDERPEGTEHEAVQRLAPYFTGVTRGPLVALARDGDVVGERRIWILRGYRGGWPLLTLGR
ncbi:MAG: glycosyltransferase family 39 protein [Gemmatimonadaceae bacterium]